MIDRAGRLGRLLVGAALVALAAGCGTGAGSPAPASSGGTPNAADRELTVYAAASLTDVLKAAALRFEAAHPGVRLVVSTDASSALRAKIEQGAPADVFLSADTKNAQALADEQLASAPVAFARNLLTIVVPVANPAAITSPADLARPGVRIVAAGPAVPITRYADEVVARLAALPGYPTGFAAAVARNVVSQEDNVRAVLAKVELGEADAAIVYVTDARSSSKVGTIALPAVANVPATYAGDVVSTSSHPADARAFLDWLAGPDGQAVLAGFGFQPPGAHAAASAAP
ncbi:MAG TPA: molybdate ABC transporter substrate-binding protein [Candidatus Limnocylindrales bacterium]